MTSGLVHLIIRKVAMPDSWTDCSFESNIFNEPIDLANKMILMNLIWNAVFLKLERQVKSLYFHGPQSYSFEMT